MPSIEYSSSKLLPNFYKNVSHMWKRNELCDVTIETEDGRTITAHRLVLSAFSPYFRVMFTCNLSESRENVIHIQNITKEILTSLISFAYTSKLEINNENVEGLLGAANLLQIKEVEKVCCDFLITQLHPTNCLGVWAVGKHYSCRELASFSLKYILKNFTAVSQGDEFELLSLSEVKLLLNDENLAVNSEEVVYNAALRWIEADRVCYLEQVLKCVRLPSLSTEFLKNTVLTNELIQNDCVCLEMVEAALNYTQSPLSEKQKISNIDYKATRIHEGFGDKLLVIGGLCSGEAVRSIEQYDMYTDVWTQLSEMPTSRYGIAVSKLRNSVYCLGGCSSGIFLDTCECYDVESDTWYSICSMSRPRKYLGAAQAYGRIFAIGGTDGFSKQKSVESFDPSKNEWTSCAEMAMSRMYAGTATIDGLIYAVGGHDGVKRLKSVECFDVVTNSWSSVKSLEKEKSVAGVATMDNILYCVGGFDGSSHLTDANMYDPRMDGWLNIASTAYPRSAASLVAMKGCLYIIGGFNGQFLQSVEMFDPRSNVWETVADMTWSRVHFGASVV